MKGVKQFIAYKLYSSVYRVSEMYTLALNVNIYLKMLNIVLPLPGIQSMHQHE